MTEVKPIIATIWVPPTITQPDRFNWFHIVVIAIELATPLSAALLVCVCIWTLWLIMDDCISWIQSHSLPTVHLVIHMKHASRRSSLHWKYAVNAEHAPYAMFKWVTHTTSPGLPKKTTTTTKKKEKTYTYTQTRKSYIVTSIVCSHFLIAMHYRRRCRRRRACWLYVSSCGNDITVCMAPECHTAKVENLCFTLQGKRG